jgi:hypothetical protein
LLDLGYFDQTTFDTLDQNGAYFISRLQSYSQCYATRFLDAINDHWLDVAHISEKIVRDFQRFALKTKHRKSTFSMLTP